MNTFNPLKRKQEIRIKYVKHDEWGSNSLFQSLDLAHGLELQGRVNLCGQL